jgi:hypothetical protein
MSLFYIPTRWKTRDTMQRLINCRNEADSIRKVYDIINEMKIGDLDYFVYDYVREILYDTFLNAKLKFLTSIELRADPAFTYMPSDCFHFIVEKDDVLRKKTAIVEFELYDEIEENIKITYKKYESFADSYIITLKNIGTILTSFLPQSEVNFVAHNVKAFKIQHQQWLTSYFLHQAIVRPIVEFSRETMQLQEIDEDAKMTFANEIISCLAQL